MSPGRKVGQLFGLLLCCASNACLSQNLLKWGRDEVTVVGAWWGETEYLWSIVIDIRNIAEVPDGQYFLPILDVRELPPSHVAPDGVLETNEPQLGNLNRVGSIPYADSFADYWRIDSTTLTVLDADSLASPDLGTLLQQEQYRGTNWPPEFGVLLKRGAAQDYALEVFAFDAKVRQQWVRIGSCPLGMGTQSRLLRTTAVVCLMPIAVSLDVLLLPVYAIDNQARWGCCCGPIPL